MRHVLPRGLRNPLTENPQDRLSRSPCTEQNRGRLGALRAAKHPSPHQAWWPCFQQSKTLRSLRPVSLHSARHVVFPLNGSLVSKGAHFYGTQVQSKGAKCHCYQHGEAEIISLKKQNRAWTPAGDRRGEELKVSSSNRLMLENKGPDLNRPKKPRLKKGLLQVCLNCAV